MLYLFSFVIVRTKVLFCEYWHNLKMNTIYLCLWISLRFCFVLSIFTFTVEILFNFVSNWLCLCRWILLWYYLQLDTDRWMCLIVSSIIQSIINLIHLFCWRYWDWVSDHTLQAKQTNLYWQQIHMPSLIWYIPLNASPMVLKHHHPTILSI